MQCDSYPGDCRKDLFSSMLPVYKELLEEKLRILIFSGDVVSLFAEGLIMSFLLSSDSSCISSY